MTIDQIENGQYYACQCGDTLRPIRVDDRIPTGKRPGLICVNLDTLREIFIPERSVAKRIKEKIENLNQWRIDHGYKL